MKVDRIRLASFRNIGLLDLVFGEGVTVLVGDNAQGKTNLLEAVLVMTLGRSHRTRRERDFIRIGDDQAVIRVDITRRDGRHMLRMAIPASGPRSLRVDGRVSLRVGDIMGRLNAVLFSPEDLRIVKDEPDVRRGFLNREISQLMPPYFASLQRYTRALKQRQAALREPLLHGTLGEWDEQLSLEGCHITAVRRSVIGQLSAYCAKWHERLTNGAEELGLEYMSSISAETPAAYMERMERARAQDIAMKKTSLGPHRDDMRMLIAGRDARLFASQGQQRTAALALRLSEVELIREMTGETPVLMLDDVFSELDPKRRTLLLGSLRGAQTLITCTDIDTVEALRGARVLRVKDGCFAEEMPRLEAGSVNT